MLPPDQVPATARAMPFLRAASGLEQTGQLIAARDAYLGVCSHWSDEDNACALAGLGLANIAYQNGDFTRAEKHLRDNLRRIPASTMSWNNLAYVLLARHCAGAAVDAIQCAIRIDPLDQNLQHSLHDIQAGSDLVDQSRWLLCSPIPACPSEAVQYTQ